MANEEQLALLRQGVEVWNKWREENPDVEIQLERADLSEAKLFEINLKEADLSEASLRGADLRGAEKRLLLVVRHTNALCGRVA